jgi:hypothetical protein
MKERLEQKVKAYAEREIRSVSMSSSGHVRDKSRQIKRSVERMKMKIAMVM